MGTLIVVGLIFAVIGAVFAGAGIATMRGGRRFEASAARATATVSDVRSRAVGRTGGGMVWVPAVRFQTADGRTVEAEAGGGTNGKQWEPGQTLEVRYDPADPTDVRVPGSAGWLIRGAFIGMGVLFAVLGLLIVVAGVAVG